MAAFSFLHFRLRYTGNAIVVISAVSSAEVSKREYCTTIGTLLVTNIAYGVSRGTLPCAMRSILIW